MGDAGPKAARLAGEAMTLAEVSDLAQTVAAVAVVVSLVYLAIQTRQAARNAKAAIHENRTATILGHIEHMTDSEFHSVWTKAGRAAPGLTDDEIGRYRLFVGGLALVWEERFRQKREGLLDENRWASTEHTITLFMMMPGFRATVGGMLPRWDPDFRALMEQHVAQGRTAPAAEAQAGWRAAAAQELAAMKPPAA